MTTPTAFGGTGAGGNDVLEDAAAAAPVLVGRAIDGLLRRRGRMHGGHQAALDAPLVMHHLRDRRQAVGGAGGVGDDRLALVGLVVDAEHEHRRVVLRRRRQDHLLRARIEVLLRRGLVEEQAGRLDDDIDADLVPLQVGRIAFLGQADALAIDDDVAAVDLDVALESAVDGVVLEHVGEVVGLEQVVDGDDLDVACEVLHGRAQHVAADAAEAVDAYLDRHYRTPDMREAGKPAILAVLPARPQPNMFPTLRRLVLLLSVFAFSPAALAWSALGHRLVGELAERHLSPAPMRR
jgi:hypothetical protein